MVTIFYHGERVVQISNVRSLNDGRGYKKRIGMHKTKLDTNIIRCKGKIYTLKVYYCAI